MTEINKEHQEFVKEKIIQPSCEMSLELLAITEKFVFEKINNNPDEFFPIVTINVIVNGYLEALSNSLHGVSGILKGHKGDKEYTKRLKNFTELLKKAQILMLDDLAECFEDERKSH